jgi:hypothetical protein
MIVTSLQQKELSFYMMCPFSIHYRSVMFYSIGAAEGSYTRADPPYLKIGHIGEMWLTLTNTLAYYNMTCKLVD